MTKKEFIDKVENTSRGFSVTDKKTKTKYHIKWDIDYFKITINDEEVEELSSTDDVVEYFTPILDLK